MSVVVPWNLWLANADFNPAATRLPTSVPSVICSISAKRLSSSPSLSPPPSNLFPAGSLDSDSGDAAGPPNNLHPFHEAFLLRWAAAQSQYPGSLYSPLHSMWMGAAAKQYSAGFKREDQNGVASDVGGENGHYGQPGGGAGSAVGEGGVGGNGGDSHSHPHNHHHHHQIADFKPAPESLISTGLTAADYMSTSMSSSASQPRKAHEGTSSAAAAAAAATASASLSSSTAYPYYSPYGGAGFAPKSSAVLSTAAARSPKQKARNTAGKKSSAVATIDHASN